MKSDISVSGRLGEVVDLAKSGADNETISEKLGIMKSTVKTYLHTARSKGLLPKGVRRPLKAREVRLTNVPKDKGKQSVSLEIGPKRNDGRVTVIVHAPVKEVGAILEHLTARYVG